MNKSKADLEESIQSLTYKIKQLKHEEKKSETTSNLYNRLLIERAVLRQELQYAPKTGFLDFIKRKIRVVKKEKLICDYFN